MSLVFLAIGLVVVAAAALAGYRYSKLRGARLVVCPDNEKPATVELAARRAAISSLLGGSDLRLETCSRWPEKRGCGQDCLSQIEARPEDCVVRNILTRWYAGKNCVACGRDLSRLDWAERKPALLSPDGTSVDWEHLEPDQLPEILATHSPVCFDCHVSDTFRRMYPKLVVDRPRDRTGASPDS